MAVEPENQVAEIVSAAGGRLVSRIRLQKIAYLLDQLGTESGFEYRYYHYGPYSRDLDNAVLDAEAFDRVTENFHRRQSDGARYSVFEAKDGRVVDQFDFLWDDTLREHVKRWSVAPVTVLELAATAHWLVTHESVDDWKAEIVRRKGSKTQNGRLEQALDLLSDVQLPPGVLAAG